MAREFIVIEVDGAAYMVEADCDVVLFAPVVVRDCHLQWLPEDVNVVMVKDGTAYMPLADHHEETKKLIRDFRR